MCGNMVQTKTRLKDLKPGDIFLTLGSKLYIFMYNDPDAGYLARRFSDQNYIDIFSHHRGENRVILLTDL